MKYNSEIMENDVSSIIPHPSSFSFDKPLLIVVGLLALTGLLMVYSASNAFSRDQVGDSLYYLKKQVIWYCIGIFLMLIAMFFNYQKYRLLSWLTLIISLGLLILIYIPGFGVEINGSTRWVKFGKYAFQPVEIAKLALIIYMARFLSQKADRIKSFKQGILPSLLIFSIFLILIYGQPDFGSIILIGLIAVLMLFVGGARAYQIILLIVLAGLFIGFEIWREPYRMKRWIAFMNPWGTSDKEGYHIIQSYYALGIGGVFGTGLGAGIQKLHYLPTPHTDFIFSVIGEELGFIGSLSVIGLFMVTVWRGIHISLTTQDRFGSLLALGISLLIGFQAIINIAVVAGALPTKGITLPFISFGGSSLIVSLISIGILLNISKQKNLKNQDV